MNINVSVMLAISVERLKGWVIVSNSMYQLQSEMERSPQDNKQNVFVRKVI